ncbi:hypothetical protein [Lysinibacillus sp. NPDC096212]
MFCLCESGTQQQHVLSVRKEAATTTTTGGWYKGVVTDVMF